MRKLSRAEAVSAVRKNLDELAMSGSAMYGALYGSDSGDNESLDLTIARTLPEAVNETVLASPSVLLDGRVMRAHYLGGKSGTEHLSDYAAMSTSEKVVDFSIGSPLLRLVRMQAYDSPYVVTDIVPESSAEGRMQLDRYVRGTYDRPVLVKLQGSNSAPNFRYFSLKDSPEKNFSLQEWLGSYGESSPKAPVAVFEYVPVAEYDEDIEECEVPDRLLQPVIYRLTGMVLAIYGEAEKSDRFIAKSDAWLK